MIGELECVIAWLENGCDVLKAVDELTIFKDKLNRQAQEAPKGTKVLAAAVKLNGIVYPGKRHNEIIGMLANIGMPTPISGEQGFIDDMGRFLTRREAGELAIASCQINSLRWPGMGLDSVEIFPRRSSKAESVQSAETPRQFAERLPWMSVNGKPDFDQWENRIAYRDAAQRQIGRDEAEADKKRYEVFAERRIAKIGSDIEVLNARYAEVVDALKGLGTVKEIGGEVCFCEKRIDNPMMKEHTRECKAARKSLSNLNKEKK
jgi:hypothetical protein